MLACSMLAIPAGADAAVAVTVQLSPATIRADGTSTSSATATVTGGVLGLLDTVTFSSSDSGIRFGPVTNNGNGTYTTTLTSSTKAGTPTITATDTSASPPASGQATLTQIPGPAHSISAFVVPDVIPADGSSTSVATATVLDAFGNLVRGDDVTISSSDPGERVGPTTGNPNGTYGAQITSSTATEQATITAVDRSVAPSISADTSLTQKAATTTTSLVVSPSTSATNQTVTLSASVSSSGTGTPGTITFARGPNLIRGCQALPVTASDPTAMCQVAFSAASSPEQLAAGFTPAPGSSASASLGTANLVVTPDGTSTALTTSSPTVDVGAPTIYTATVSSAHSGPFEPSGTVTFRDRGQPIPACEHRPVGRRTPSTATCTISYSSPGAHRITAAYSGDSNFASSRSSRFQPVTVTRTVLGTIAATMGWSFRYTPSYTEVLALVVHGAPRGSTVLVSCQGGGCPYSTRSFAISVMGRCLQQQASRCVPPARTIHLAPAFHNSRLAVGDHLTVTITKPDWVGKHYLFAIRAGHGPRVEIGCLAPASTVPGARC